MLSRNKLRHGYIEPRLKIYCGETHPHTAQLPEAVQPLPKHPRSNQGDFHFGLRHYSDPASSQINGTKKLSKK